MENFRVGQLTKAMVAALLKNMADPCAETARVTRCAITVALDGCSPGEAGAREKVVQDACQGAMTGLLLAEQDLPKGAALILQAVMDVAQEKGLDHTEAINSALRGIADMQRFATPEHIHDIQHELETRFMGAGQAFAGILKDLREAEKARLAAATVAAMAPPKDFTL